MSTQETEIPLVVITYHDGFLWSLKHKKIEYENKAALIFLSEEDLKALNIRSGQEITLKNRLGKIKVKAALDDSCPQGFGLMPKSFIINRLISFEDNLPDSKGIKTVAGKGREEW